MSENEQAARKLGADRKALRQRLEQARQMLVADLRRGFGKGRFNFQAKTLTGENGLVLRWRLRRWPNKPPSYENQQTTTGDVFAEHHSTTATEITHHEHNTRRIGY